MGDDLGLGRPRSGARGHGEHCCHEPDEPSMATGLCPAHFSLLRTSPIIAAVNASGRAEAAGRRGPGRGSLCQPLPAVESQSGLGVR